MLLVVAPRSPLEQLVSDFMNLVQMAGRWAIEHEGQLIILGIIFALVPAIPPLLQIIQKVVGKFRPLPVPTSTFDKIFDRLDLPALPRNLATPIPELSYIDRKIPIPWAAKKMLILCKPGIGKTREAIRITHELARRELENITILLPKESILQAPISCPRDVDTHNVILVLDDLPKYFMPVESIESFEKVLREITTFFSKRGKFRIIATARTEELERLRCPKARLWEEFAEIRLPDLTDEETFALLNNLAAHFKLAITNEAQKKLVQANYNRVFKDLVMFLQQKSNEGKSPIEIEDAIEFEKYVGEGWRIHVFPKLERDEQTLFLALAFMKQAHMTPYVDLASHLASINSSWHPIWKTKRIQNAIKSLEAQGWIRCEGDHIRCYEPYLEKIEDFQTSYRVFCLVLLGLSSDTPGERIANLLLNIFAPERYQRQLKLRSHARLSLINFAHTLLHLSKFEMALTIASRLASLSSLDDEATRRMIANIFVSAAKCNTDTEQLVKAILPDLLSSRRLSTKLIAVEAAHDLKLSDVLTDAARNPSSTVRREAIRRLYYLWLNAPKQVSDALYHICLENLSISTLFNYVCFFYYRVLAQLARLVHLQVPNPLNQCFEPLFLISLIIIVKHLLDEEKAEDAKLLLPIWKSVLNRLVLGNKHRIILAKRAGDHIYGVLAKLAFDQVNTAMKMSRAMWSYDSLVQAFEKLTPEEKAIALRLISSLDALENFNDIKYDILSIASINNLLLFRLVRLILGFHSLKNLKEVLTITDSLIEYGNDVARYTAFWIVRDALAIRDPAAKDKYPLLKRLENYLFKQWPLPGISGYSLTQPEYPWSQSHHIERHDNIAYALEMEYKHAGKSGATSLILQMQQSPCPLGSTATGIKREIIQSLEHTALMGSPAEVLDAFTQFLETNDEAIQSTLARSLARIRLAYAELVDNYLREHPTSYELHEKVLACVPEEVWAFVIARGSDNLPLALVINPALRPKLIIGLHNIFKQCNSLLEAEQLIFNTLVHEIQSA